MHCKQGTCKVRNEIETKRNEIKRNETKSKRNETTLHFVSFRFDRFRFVSFGFVSFCLISSRSVSFRFVSISFRTLQVPCWGTHLHFIGNKLTVLVVIQLKNCSKQQLLTDPQHNVKNIFCLKHKYLHLLIYYLSGYFRRAVTFAIFNQTVRVVSNFAKIEKKQN